MGGLDENMQSLKAENEKLKAWLWRYQGAKIESLRLYGEWQELVESHRSAGAIEYTGMPSSGCGGGDLAVYMAQEEKLEERAKAASKKAHLIYEEISAIIEKLQDPEEKAVMSMRYLQLNGTRAKSWEEIADVLGYAQRSVYWIHGNALLNLQPFFKTLH